MGFMQTAKAVLNVVAGISGIVAAILWFKSATVTVAEAESRDEWDGVVLSRDGVDLVETAVAQSKWSRNAAVAATVAALAQAVTQFLP
jgi:hypothetical protein